MPSQPDTATGQTLGLPQTPKKRKQTIPLESSERSEHETGKRSRGASSSERMAETALPQQELVSPAGAFPSTTPATTTFLPTQHQHLPGAYSTTSQQSMLSSLSSQLSAETSAAQQTVLNSFPVSHQQQANQQYSTLLVQQQQPQHSSSLLSPQIQFLPNPQLLVATDPATGQPSQLASILAIQQQQAARFAMVGQLLASNPLVGQIFLQQLMNGGGAVPQPATSIANVNHHALPIMAGMGPAYSMGQALNPGAATSQLVPPFAIQGASPGVPGTGVMGAYQHHIGLQGQQASIPPPLTSTVYHGVPGSTASLLSPTPSARGGDARSTAVPPATILSLRQTLTMDSIGPDVPPTLPVVLFLEEDETKLSAYQILLRSQVEAFSASSDDLATHARGRNKPITLGQVGIRCKHCSHLSHNRRNKGSVYFPYSLVGLYQAAQNMGSSHFHGESCAEMAEDLKQQFVDVLACKSTVGSGKQYWAKAAKKLGLLDTEQGIRFVRDLIVVLPPAP